MPHPGTDATTYKPKGRMKVWLDAMQADPARVWSSEEAGAVMGVPLRQVSGYANFAVSKGVIYRGERNHRAVYSLNPFAPEEAKPFTGMRRVERVKRAEIPWTSHNDPRIPRVVPGWKPPVMVAPRGNA